MEWHGEVVDSVGPAEMPGHLTPRDPLCPHVSVRLCPFECGRLCSVGLLGHKSAATDAVVQAKYNIPQMHA